MHTTNSSYFFNMLYSFVHLNEILTFKWLKFELNLISSLTLCINVTSKASRLADSCITFVYGLGFVFLCFFFGPRHIVCGTLVPQAAAAKRVEPWPLGCWGSPSVFFKYFKKLMTFGVRFS